MFSKADTIHDDGSTDTGYFISDMLVGIILGSLVTLVVNSFIGLCLWTCFNDNYVYVPKTKLKGIYVQLDDGRLYKRQ